jgi:hypothetical protein
VHAQLSISLEVKTGYSSYAMNELSHTLHYYQENSNLPLKVTNDYPVYLTFGGSITGKFERFEIGVDYCYYSTGARSHYKDYSGEAGFDQIAIAHAIGLFGKYILFEKNAFRLKASLLISLYTSSVNFNEYLRTLDLQIENKLEVVSKSVGITPMIEPVYHFTNTLYAGIRVGFCFDTEAVLHLKDNIDAQLIDNSNKPVHTQWSGLRSEFFVGVRLSQNPNTK